MAAAVGPSTPPPLGAVRPPPSKGGAMPLVPSLPTATGGRLAPSRVAPVSATITRVGAPSAVIIRHGAVGDGQVTAYTSAGGGSRTLELDDAKPETIAAKRAHDELIRMIKGIHPNLKYLNVNTSFQVMTLIMEDGRRETLTVEQAKVALSRTNPRVNFDEEIAQRIDLIQALFVKAGYSPNTYYSSRGASGVGSAAGGKALAVTNQSHPFIQGQQSDSLVSDTKKDQHTIAGLIDQLPEDDQKEAVEKVLRAEARALRIRDAVTDHVNTLNAAYIAAPTDDKRRELLHWRQLRAKLDEMNRHALWATAIFTDPAVCCEQLLINYHGVYCGKIKDPANRPTLEDFRVSAEAGPLLKHAAEIASTLITDNGEYRIYCLEHDIPPRDNHANRFLNQMGRVPREIDFETLGIPFTAPERKAAHDLVQGASDEADDELAGLAIDDADMPAVMLKKAIQDLQETFHDKTEPSTASKAWRSVQGFFS